MSITLYFVIMSAIFEIHSKRQEHVYFSFDLTNICLLTNYAAMNRNSIQMTIQVNVDESKTDQFTNLPGCQITRILNIWFCNSVVSTQIIKVGSGQCKISEKNKTGNEI